MKINTDNLQVNKYGTNANIKAHILDKQTMKSLKFSENYYEGTDHEQYSPYWYLNKYINLPKKYKGTEISFNVNIYKDTEEIGIDVLDEAFGQPYDYQLILDKSPNFELALIVQEQVEHFMAKLQKAGVISGHNVGDYI